MLGGQKAPYKLLVRAVSQETGLEVPHIAFVASEDFVVLSSLLLCQPCSIHNTKPTPTYPLDYCCELPVFNTANMNSSCEQVGQTQLAALCLLLLWLLWLLMLLLLGAVGCLLLAACCLLLAACCLLLAACCLLLAACCLLLAACCLLLAACCLLLAACCLLLAACCLLSRPLHL